jgi:hypothetical protein
VTNDEEPNQHDLMPDFIMIIYIDLNLCRDYKKISSIIGRDVHYLN